MNIDKEELFNRALDHAAQRVGEMEQSRWLIEAQANYYLEKYNELLEEHKQLFDEHEQLKKEYNALNDKNYELTEDLRKLEGKPDISDVINNTTEENK